jgi:hypothetical protein
MPSSEPRSGGAPVESWFVVVGEGSARTTLGPLPREEIARLVAAGSIGPASLVARVGAAAWSRADDDPLLTELFAESVPPLSDLADTAGPTADSAWIAAGSPRTYSFATAFRLGWLTFRRQWGPLLAVSAILIGFAVALQVPGRLADLLAPSIPGNSRGAMQALGGCVGSVLHFFVGLPLAAGAFIAGAQAVRGRLAVGDVFAGFRRYLSVLVAGLLITVAVIVVFVPLGLAAMVVAIIASQGQKAGGSDPLLWIVILVLLGILALALYITVLVRVTFALPIAADPVLSPATRPIGPWDAFVRSWRNTRRIGPSIAILFIVTGLIAIASLLLLCVGYLLIGYPLGLAVMGAMHELVNRRGPAPATAPAGAALPAT